MTFYAAHEITYFAAVTTKLGNYYKQHGGQKYKCFGQNKLNKTKKTFTLVSNLNLYFSRVSYY